MTRKNIKILVLGLLLIAAIVATIIHNPKSPGSEESGTSSMELPSSTSLKVSNTGNGWEYEIYVNSTLFIFQEYIPGVAGNKKFASQSDAMACGEFVIQKLKENKRPSVTIEEIDSLGIAF